jgi:hypothetical protein
MAHGAAWNSEVKRVRRRIVSSRWSRVLVFIELRFLPAGRPAT